MWPTCSWCATPVVPGAVHPIISIHPETGRKCLYLGRREWASVVGFDLQQSESLLDELWHYASLPENIWRQKWQTGDLILWDPKSYASVTTATRGDTSIHVQFLTDQVAFRFIMGLDAQPWLASAITTFTGSNTVSTQVTLAARA